MQAFFALSAAAALAAAQGHAFPSSLGWQRSARSVLKHLLGKTIWGGGVEQLQTCLR